MPNTNIRGFTLIELLIVVVIIGILAAIALPKFGYTKEKAMLAEMRSDLRNLAVAQEVYSADNGGAYYGGALPNPALVWGSSPGVTMTLSGVSATGWGATATRIGTSRTCAIYFGTGGPLGPATVQGSVACS